MTFFYRGHANWNKSFHLHCWAQFADQYDFNKRVLNITQNIWHRSHVASLQVTNMLVPVLQLNMLKKEQKINRNGGGGSFKWSTIVCEVSVLIFFLRFVSCPCFVPIRDLEDVHFKVHTSVNDINVTQMWVIRLFFWNSSQPCHLMQRQRFNFKSL